jgi:hypothetical protein
MQQPGRRRSRNLFDWGQDRLRAHQGHAAGEITWSALRERGFENCAHVLGALGARRRQFEVNLIEQVNRMLRSP